ncbi:MAG: acyltransferase [Pseudomonadota bacterium]
MLARIAWIIGAVWRRVGGRLSTLWHRLTLEKVGTGTRIQPRVSIHRTCSVRLGADCLIWRGAAVSSEDARGYLHTGDRVQINQGAYLDVSGGLILADDVLISAEASIYTHDHGLDPHATPELVPKEIGHSAWIGTRAIILPGCRSIGARAVIGAGAVVAKDVPAGAIMAGNPARQIGQRDVVGAVA